MLLIVNTGDRIIYTYHYIFLPLGQAVTMDLHLLRSWRTSSRVNAIEIRTLSSVLRKFSVQNVKHESYTVWKITLWLR